MEIIFDNRILTIKSESSSFGQHGIWIINNSFWDPNRLSLADINRPKTPFAVFFDNIKILNKRKTAYLIIVM